MKVMFSAGEASGDMHAAAVASEIRRLCPEAELFGMGGSAMARAGVRIIYDIQNLGIIGVVEVIRHLPLFFRLRDLLRKAMEEERPDVLVCVDYPGFNMKIARLAKLMGIPVVYYIAPTVWAWHKGRAKYIARDVAQVASIFPFEEEAYRKAGAQVTFVGHPLVDVVRPTMSKEEAMDYYRGRPEARRVLLMPGSRKNEVAGLLPEMLRAALRLHEEMPCQFFLPRAETIPQEMLDAYLKEAPGLSVEVTEGCQYDVMQICHACVASSGTATLETALMELPTVLVYRLAPLSWRLAQLLVQVKYVGLPNLLVDREVMPELLQDEVKAEYIHLILHEWLTDEAARQETVKKLKDVRSALGPAGAVCRTAELVLRTAEGRNEE